MAKVTGKTSHRSRKGANAKASGAKGRASQAAATKTEQIKIAGAVRAQREESTGIKVVRERGLSYESPFMAIHGLSAIERSVMVEAGVPALLLSRLAETLAMSKERLYEIIGVSRATVDRKLKAHSTLSTADSEHAMGMARLVGQVEQMVQESGNPEGFDAGRWVAEFLGAPSPALGGRRPGDLMRTSDGRTVVSTLVAQMQSGAYA